MDVEPVEPPQYLRGLAVPLSSTRVGLVCLTSCRGAARTMRRAGVTGNRGEDVQVSAPVKGCASRGTWTRIGLGILNPASLLWDVLILNSAAVAVALGIYDGDVICAFSMSSD